MYSREFKEFVKNGVENYFIGTGNPNAKILLIGKESAIAENDYNHRKWYDENALSWKSHIEQNTCEKLEYEVTVDHAFRKDKSWGKNTWSKYQQLVNHTYNKEPRPYYIDFLQKAFTTEINDSPNKNTSTANKIGLNERKTLFKESEFIQNFPIIVLACSNYIRNREIDEIFNVELCDTKKYSSYNWFHTYYSEDKSKLVIHTRQLSANVKPELLKDMGMVIREHLKL